MWPKSQWDWTWDFHSFGFFNCWRNGCCSYSHIYKRLASLLATKHSQPYSGTMGSLRCRISFLRCSLYPWSPVCPYLYHRQYPWPCHQWNHGPNVLETLLFCTKFLFSCSLKHFQVQFYINFVSAGHHFSFKMFLVKSKIGQGLRLCQLIASPRNNKPR